MEDLIIHIKYMMKFYKKIFIFCFLCGFHIQCVFSQDEVYVASFIKRIEYNFIDAQSVKKVGDELIIAYLCNIDGKSNMEKLFFGDFNAGIEFFYAPSFEASTKGEAGFRIVRDSLNTSYILEVKHISNYEEVWRETDDKYPVQGIPAGMMDSIFFDSLMLSGSNDNELEMIWRKQINDERLKLFKVETLSFTISDRFAEKLYKKMVSFIDNFKAKGRLMLSADGYSVTFRNIVDDEVWSLKIHEPQGNALKMSDLCRQIITDAKKNTFDELKYIEVL
jgi:hypothetical protein